MASLRDSDHLQTERAARQPLSPVVGRKDKTLLPTLFEQKRTGQMQGVECLFETQPVQRTPRFDTHQLARVRVAPAPPFGPACTAADEGLQDRAGVQVDDHRWSRSLPLISHRRRGEGGLSPSFYRVPFIPFAMSKCFGIPSVPYISTASSRSVRACFWSPEAVRSISIRA